MKPLTRTVASRSAKAAPAKPRYTRWRERNPELYRERQRELMRKRRKKTITAAE